MKKLIIFLILSSIICQNFNPIQKITDIIECVSKSNLLETAIEKIKEALNSKDLTNLINVGITLFKQFKDEITQCVKKDLRKLSSEEEEDDRDDIKLGYPKYVYVLYTQIGEKAFQWYDLGGISLLKELCHRYHGQKTWYCVYLAQN